MNKNIWTGKVLHHDDVNKKKWEKTETLNNLPPISNLNEDFDLPLSKKNRKKPKPNYSELTPIVWRNVFIMGLLHLGFLHGAIMTFFCDYRTILVGKYTK